MYWIEFCVVLCKNFFKIANEWKLEKNVKYWSERLSEWDINFIQLVTRMCTHYVVYKYKCISAFACACASINVVYYFKYQFYLKTFIYYIYSIAFLFCWFVFVSADRSRQNNIIESTYYIIIFEWRYIESRENVNLSTYFLFLNFRSTFNIGYKFHIINVRSTQTHK